ncbi:MAG: DUF4212 domain-containing protein [Sulfuricella sp.]|nr:DUF4212 domain-containing protein [Sulfuricella sp.]
MPNPLPKLSGPLTARHREYWRRNLRLTEFLLVIWFAVTFVLSYYAQELNDYEFLGFPLGFYFGAQGAMIVYVAIVWYYVRAMNRLDIEYDVQEEQK